MLRARSVAFPAIATGVAPQKAGVHDTQRRARVFGLDMRGAADTSLLVIAVLTVPTLATRWALGHIDWAVAAAFALGAVPTSAASGRLAHHVTATSLRQGFGRFLVAYRLVGT